MVFISLLHFEVKAACPAALCRMFFGPLGLQVCFPVCALWSVLIISLPINLMCVSSERMLWLTALEEPVFRLRHNFNALQQQHFSLLTSVLLKPAFSVFVAMCMHIECCFDGYLLQKCVIIDINTYSVCMYVSVLFCVSESVFACMTVHFNPQSAPLPLPSSLVSLHLAAPIQQALSLWLPVPLCFYFSLSFFFLLLGGGDRELVLSVAPAAASVGIVPFSFPVLVFSCSISSF